MLPSVSRRAERAEGSAHSGPELASKHCYGVTVTRRPLPLTDDLHDYVLAHSSPEDPVLARLAAETAGQFAAAAVMQIGADQGTLLTLLAATVAPRLAVEVGTFTGYSAICLARGLAPGGRLICCDISEEWTSVARRYWQDAGLADRIELRLGRPWTRCGRCRPGRTLTWPSSTRTSPSTSATGRRSSRAPGPAA